MVSAKPATKSATVTGTTVVPSAATYVMLVISPASTAPRSKVTLMSVGKVLALLCATVNTKVLLAVPSTAVRLGLR